MKTMPNPAMRRKIGENAAIVEPRKITMGVKRLIPNMKNTRKKCVLDALDRRSDSPEILLLKF